MSFFEYASQRHKNIIIFATIMMNVLTAIEKRRSVRTFDSSLPVSKQLIEDLDVMTDLLMRPWHCGRIRFGISKQQQDKPIQSLGKYGIVTGARYFLTLCTTPELETEVAAAFMAEQVVLWLTGQGIGTVWIGSEPDRELLARQAGADSELTLAAIIPFGYADKPRLMERLMRTVASSSTRKPFEKLFYRTVDDGTIMPLMPSNVDNNTRRALEAVRLAPSSFNGQPWRFVTDGKKWYVFGDYKTAAGSDKERMKHLDMGIAMCHFALADQELAHVFPHISINTESPHFSTPPSWHPIATIEEFVLRSKK